MPVDVIAISLGVVGFSVGLEGVRRARNCGGAQDEAKSVPLLKKLRRCRWTHQHQKATELTNELALQRTPSVCSIDGTPLDFECPLTLELMEDPVKAADGCSYEKSALQLWLSSGNRTSPSTGAPLANTRLVPDRRMRECIRKWKADEERARPASRVVLQLNEFGTIAGLCVAKCATQFVVTQVLCESQAANQGVSPGDFLESINGAPVPQEAAEMRNALAAAERPLEIVLGRPASGNRNSTDLAALQRAGSHLLL